MGYTSDIRERKKTEQIDTGLSVAYEVRQQTGSPVNLIYGVLNKETERIARLNVDIRSDTAYISIEKFSAISHIERKNILSAISDHIEAILTESSEPEIQQE